MRIVFCYKGRYYVRDAVILECLSAIAKKYGHSVDLIYDQDLFGVTDNVITVPFLNKMFSSLSKTIESLESKNPSMVIFIDGFNRSEWNREISCRVERISGNIVTVALRYWDVPDTDNVYDYILVGEPELAFEKFVREEIYSNKKGAYKFSGIADLDNLPIPDKELFSRYVNFRDSYIIYTSKGCPYGCSYCEETIYKNTFGDSYFRRKRPDKIISELEEAKARFDIKEIIYKDSVFALDKGWLKDYLEKYKKKVNLPYKCFGKAEVFDDEIALMLKESNCYCVEFGVQTFNEYLKSKILKREEKTDVLMRAFSVCDKHKLRYDIDHMFGIPGEKIEDHKSAAKIYTGLKYINRIKCHNLTFYRQAEIYRYAPSWVKDSKDYQADFFSSVAGEENMIETNRAFQKYYKMLPLFSKRVNLFILKADSWKLFKFIPHIFVVFSMLILAVKNRDRRFGVYLKYYPLRIRRTIFG